MGLMQKVFGDLNSKEVKKLEKIADQVMALEEPVSYTHLTLPTILLV